MRRVPEAFSGPAVGAAATTPDTVKALRVILKDPAAESIFKQLLAEATSEGQLYALAGLYVINPEFARRVAKPYESSRFSIPTWKLRGLPPQPIVSTSVLLSQTPVFLETK